MVFTLLSSVSKSELVWLVVKSIMVFTLIICVLMLVLEVLQEITIAPSNDATYGIWYHLQDYSEEMKTDWVTDADFQKKKY